MRRNRALFIALLLVSSVSYGEEKKKKLTLKDLLKSSTKTSTRSTTVAGVRGLDETSAGIDTQARDFNAVDRMDKLAVSSEEIKTFLEEGKLK